MPARIAWALASLALLLPAAALAAEPRAQLPDIEDEVMCPVCGTTLELAEAPQAERERELIRGLIDEGMTKDEIKDRLVAEYGDEVLATPRSEGFGIAAWFVPGLAILVALAAIVLWQLRSRRLSRARRDDPPAPGSEPEDLERLQRDLSSYDL